jgi:hypothetical protein
MECLYCGRRYTARDKWNACKKCGLGPYHKTCVELHVCSEPQGKVDEGFYNRHED